MCVVDKLAAMALSRRQWAVSHTLFAHQPTVSMQRSQARLECQRRVPVPTGCWLFHPSWHVCVYKRMFEGENKVLAKEGVIHFLELYEVKSLPHSPELSEVMASQLLPILAFIRT